MKAIGTKTDSSTRVMAMIGAVISLIACLVASARGQLGVFLHHPLDILDHHDGVVDDDADGQHHAEQRDGVGAVAHGQQDGEGADQADRHRDGRDQRGAQRAEEQEDDDDDEARRPRAGSDDHFPDGVDHEGGVLS